MMVTKVIRMRGFQFMDAQRDGGTRKTANRVRIDVDDTARVEVAGIGTGKTATFVTSSPHVRRFLRDLEAASIETAHNHRAPYTKADQVGVRKSGRRQPDDLVPCPVCDGAGWDDCHLCSGGGRVSIRTAKAIGTQ
jgi:hypothetical protein